MKMQKKILSLIITVLMVIPAFALCVNAAPEDVIYDDVIYRINGETATVIGYDGTSGKVVIPEKVLGATVNWIEGYAFNANPKVTSVEIKSTAIKGISAGAFANCRNLRTAEFTDSVTNIYENAFFGCTSLLSMDLKNVNYVGNLAFGDCHSLQKITSSVDSGNFEIGEKSFYSCRNLGTVEWPEKADSIKIGSEAFSSCVALEELKFPANISSIGSGAFLNCMALKNIDFSQAGQLTSISLNCFNGCTSLEELTVSGSIQSVSSYSFINCSSLKKVILKNGVNNVDVHTFDDDEALEKVFLPSSVTKIKSAVFNTYKTTTFYCPNEDLMKTMKKNGAVNCELAMCADDIHGTDAEHEFEEEAVTVLKPTYTTEGLREYRCTVCGSVKRTETIQKLSAQVAYPDVTEDSWYYNAVIGLSEAGVFTGMEDGTFGPNVYLTRGMVAVMMFKLTGNTDYIVAENHFSDVKDGDWYYKAVEWAYEKGAVTGMGDGTFAPNTPISRQQLCVMITALAEKYYGKTMSNLTNYFDDDALISDWARAAVYKCRTSGIVSGMSANIFSPISSVTRAQAAVMFAALSAFTG